MTPYLKALRLVNHAADAEGVPSTPFHRSHIFAVNSRHEDVLEGLRNHHPRWDPMGSSRLSFHRCNGTVRLPIGFLACEHPERGLGQMPGDGTNGSGMSFFKSDALIKLNGMALGPGFSIDADDVGGFHEGPLEVAVDIGSQGAEAGFAAGGMHARGGTGIRGQMSGTGEPVNVADFGCDDDAQDEPDTRRAHEQFQLRGGLE